MNKKQIKELQNRENTIWKYLKKNVDKVVLDMVSELIEINIELERESNQ